VLGATALARLPLSLGHPGGMDENRALPDNGEEATIEAAPAAAIVIGHDGSAGADAALQVGLQLAADLGAPVVILRAWSMVTAPRPPGWTFGYVASTDEIADAVRAELESDVRGLVGRFPGIEVTYRAYHAGPAQTLIRASRTARMLVVGCRGLGGFREMVLGSVSDQCVRHAHCPVLVARSSS
jgi:nucleotide-binding universal stress UspA family protein